MAIREDLEQSLKELDELIEPFLQTENIVYTGASDGNAMLNVFLEHIGNLRSVNDLKLPYEGFKIIAESLYGKTIYCGDEYQILENASKEFVSALEQKSKDHIGSEPFQKMVEAASKAIQLTYQYNSEKYQEAYTKQLEQVTIISTLVEELIKIKASVGSGLPE